MVTSRSAAGWPSRTSLKVAASPATRSFGWVTGTSSMPWPVGASAVVEVAPRVTKVSMRLLLRVATTSVASAGMLAAISASVPRQRFCSPPCL